MKVIFLQDIPDVAQAGELKEVASGYGRNYLLPRGLAILATPAAADRVKAQQKTIKRQREQLSSEMSELATQLEGKELTIEANVGSGERLFGSITNADIAAELEKTHQITIDKKKIDLSEPIKKPGRHEVTIKLLRDIEPRITVTVIAKEASQHER